MEEGVSVKNSAGWGWGGEGGGYALGGEEEDWRLTGGAHLNGWDGSAVRARFGSTVFARHFHARRVVARRTAARSASSLLFAWGENARWTLFGPATTASDGVLISELWLLCIVLRVGVHISYTSDKPRRPWKRLHMDKKCRQRNESRQDGTPPPLSFMYFYFIGSSNSDLLKIRIELKYILFRDQQKGEVYYHSWRHKHWWVLIAGNRRPRWGQSASPPSPRPPPLWPQRSSRRRVASSPKPSTASRSPGPSLAGRPGRRFNLGGWQPGRPPCRRQECPLHRRPAAPRRRRDIGGGAALLSLSNVHAQAPVRPHHRPLASISSLLLVFVSLEIVCTTTSCRVCVYHPGFEISVRNFKPGITLRMISVWVSRSVCFVWLSCLFD